MFSVLLAHPLSRFCREETGLSSSAGWAQQAPLSEPLQQDREGFCLSVEMLFPNAVLAYFDWPALLPLWTGRPADCLGPLTPPGLVARSQGPAVTAEALQTPGHLGSWESLTQASCLGI